VQASRTLVLVDATEAGSECKTTGHGGAKAFIAEVEKLRSPPVELRPTSQGCSRSKPAPQWPTQRDAIGKQTTLPYRRTAAR